MPQCAWVTFATTTVSGKQSTVALQIDSSAKVIVSLFAINKYICLSKDIYLIIYNHLQLAFPTSVFIRNIKFKQKIKFIF